MSSTDESNMWAAFIILSFKSKGQKYIDSHLSRKNHIATPIGKISNAQTPNQTHQKHKVKSKTTYKSTPVPKSVLKSRPESKPIMREFKHNDKVKVLYYVNGMGNRWFPGIIRTITKGNYYIAFDDGGYEPITKNDSITRIKMIKSI